MMYEATERRKRMSEERGARDTRDQKGGNPEMESEARKYESLTDALQELVEPEGWWAGSEEKLITELRTWAGEEPSASEGFHTSLGKLEECMWVASEVFARAGLDIVDYRQVSWDDIDAFDAPSWSEENPVLVYKGDCVFRYDYHTALGKVLELWDPFPLALFLFTLNEELGNGRSWEGTMPELATVMRQYHGYHADIPEWLLEMYRPPWATGSLPKYENAEASSRLLWPNSSEDYEAFAERMRKSVPFLEEIGIRVRFEEHPCEVRIPEDALAGHRDWERVRWVVRAPLWSRSEYL
jgi:hypothetical protein